MSTRKDGKWQLLSGCGFVQRIAPPSLSHDRRIKMDKSIIMSFSSNVLFVPTAILSLVFLIR